MQSIIITITIITMIIIINLGGRRGKLVLEKSSWIWLAATSPFEDLVHLVKILSSLLPNKMKYFTTQITKKYCTAICSIWRV